MRHFPLQDITKEKFFTEFNADVMVLLNPKTLRYEYKKDEVHIWDNVKNRKLFLLRFNPHQIVIMQNSLTKDEPHVKEIYDVYCYIVHDIAP